MAVNLRWCLLALLAWPWVTGAATPRPSVSAVAKSSDARADWFNWLQCAPEGACNRVALERFQQRDPHNAAVWMPDVSAVLHANDTRGLDAALERMADGTHFDDGVYAHARAEALAATAAGRGDAVAYAKFEIAMAMVPASAGGIARACRARAPSAHGPAACARIGHLMQASGSLVAQALGDQLLVVYAASPSERRQAALDESRVKWQQSRLADLERLPDCGHVLARLWVGDLPAAASSAQMATLILRARGIAPTPPWGWQPPPPRAPAPPYTCPP